MPNYVSNKTIEKIKHDLVRNNLISIEALTSAEEASEQENVCLSNVLVQKGFIEEETLLKLVQDNLHIPYVNLEDYILDENCLSFISGQDAKKYNILPLFKIENILTIAMADPLDLFVLNNLISEINCDIEPIICSERLINEYVKKYYFPENIGIEKADSSQIDWRNLLNEEMPDNTQAEKIVSAIITQASQESAFEIIFDPIKEGIKVKFKANGEQQEKGIIPLLLAPLCVAQVKSLSGLDSSIVNTPQLGKFLFSDDLTGIVASFPSTKGERITIKLYKPPKTIDELSLDNETKRILKSKLEETGIMLISGAELCGKSFLAYTLLNSMDTTNKNVMTVESIAKYDLKNVVQCELNEKVGFSLDNAIKHIDFQSPDILYIEEIDTENLIKLANNQKLIITESKSSKIPEELKNYLNCQIVIKDMNNILIKD